MNSGFEKVQFSLVTPSIFHICVEIERKVLSIVQTVSAEV